MASKGTLAIGIALIILLIMGGYFLFAGESITVYIDGENVTSQARISPFAGVNTDELNKEICEYTFSAMNNTTADAKSLKQGILRICLARSVTFLLTPASSATSIPKLLLVPPRIIFLKNNILPCISLTEIL